MSVSDNTAGSINEFAEDTKYYINVFNDNETTETVIYAWYDSDNKLIQADSKEVTASDFATGGKVMSIDDNFSVTAPANAAKLKIYLWDSVNGVKPVWKSLEIQKEVSVQG